MLRRLLSLSLLCACLTACGVFEINFEPTPDLVATANALATQLNAAAPSTLAPPAAATFPVATLPAPVTRLAFAREGRVVLVDIQNGNAGASVEYLLPNATSLPYNLTWSPSGEYLAFNAWLNDVLHVFYFSAHTSAAPVDLGPGSNPAWSPDSQSLAYVSARLEAGSLDDALWVVALADRVPRQLTFDENFSWSGPAFAPDGQALVAAGQSHDLMGATGNFYYYTLEYVPLDGSGVRRPVQVGAPQYEGSHLPNQLQFSPDGQWLAFSVSSHLNAACAPGAYYVVSADGSRRQTVSIPALEQLAQADQGYMVGDYAWSPTSEALAVFGEVHDCGPSAAGGTSLAGPQLSVIGLDGTERLTIPGLFLGGLSYDRTGALLAAARYENGPGQASLVEIYSAQTGQLLFSLGAGSDPVFQP